MSLPRAPASPSLHPRAGYFARPRPIAAPKMRLFAFPYAGAGAVAYHHWGAALPSDVELVALQYPGRGRLMNLPAATSIQQLSEECRRTVLAFSGTPFCFFGHSMGAVVALETAALLRHAGDALPQVFFASACRGPAPGRRGVAPTADLSDEDFLAHVMGYGGMREEILQAPELLSLVLPLLRADLGALGTWEFQPLSAFPFPIVALGGDADPTVPIDRLDGWRALTDADFERHVLPGDHFYIQGHLPSIVRLIEQAVCRVTGRATTEAFDKGRIA